MKCGLALLLLLLGVLLVHANMKAEMINKMFEDYWKWRLFISPTTATSFGYRTSNYASRLPQFTEHEIHTRALVCESFLNRAEKLERLPETLDEQLRLSLRLFKKELQTFLEGLPYKAYVFGGVNFLEGPHKSFPFIIEDTVLETEADYNHLLSRLIKIPQSIQQTIEMMREGIRMNMTYHLYSVDGVPKQIEREIRDDKLYKYAFQNISEAISPHSRSLLQKKGRMYLNDYVYPAYKKLKMFMQDEYMKHLRADIGVTSIPNGGAFYQTILEYQTTTKMTPLQVHQLGHKEVQRISKEMKEVVTALGYPHLSVRDYSAMILKEPKTFYNSKEELLDDYRDAVYNKIQPHLSKLFWKLPTQNVTLEEDTDPLAVGAYYRAGSSLTGRPGKFYIATARYDSQPRNELITLSLHEANPGHHLHFASMEENPDLPTFRKLPHGVLLPPSDFSSYNAFVEGWALYTETLGYEMGLYDDLHQRYGHLGYAMLRAVRLVVDTGMHALGWTRDQALDFAVNYLPMTKENILVELNRYITWPAQACSYKVGELKIQELRKRSREALTHKFDIRDFHQVVLNCFGPLDILEQCVDAYIQKTLALK